MEKQRPDHLEIKTSRDYRWVRFLAVFLLISLVLSGFIYFFSNSVRLSVILVVGMISYMLLMGWWAMGMMDENIRR